MKTKMFLLGKLRPFVDSNRSGLLLAFLTLTVAISCKKEEPSPAGTMMVYTLIDSNTFDSLDVLVDGQKVGSLTVPHIKRPDCGSPTSVNVLNIPLPAGTHKWSAKQIKDGKEIDEWDEREEVIKAGQCEFIKLSE